MQHKETVFSGDIVVFDLEHTSWEGFFQSNWQMPGKHREIIQIGAVILDADDDFLEKAHFLTLVRPVIHPVLSQYIIDLTGITQQAVDEDGIPFHEALDAFMAFLGEDGPVLMCNGFDGVTIKENCALHGLAFPSVFETCIDLRETFAAALEIHKDKLISAEIPALAGLDVTEPAHDALGDCRSLAAVLRHVRGQGKI